MNAKLTTEQATIIEQNHNVYIDTDSHSYTAGERNDDYGWMPIPDAWIAETQEQPQNYQTKKYFDQLFEDFKAGKISKDEMRTAMMGN